ncbi:MAG: class I SAM-dependent methyltransferase [Alphaproteobacteria bacterium]
MTAERRAEIPVLLDDPVRNHPTRGEQLDILASVIGDFLKPGDALLDLGIGVGYVARMILERARGARLVGIDMKAESLAKAREVLAPLTPSLSLIEGDLGAIESLAVPAGPYRAVVSVLTFHDLADEAKERLIRWSATRLGAGGTFFLLDRLRLDKELLFPFQVTMWERMNRVYGGSMRRADDFGTYLRDLGETNRPARFEDYMGWFTGAGLVPACLHLHGNIALFAAAKPG